MEHPIQILLILSVCKKKGLHFKDEMSASRKSINVLQAMSMGSKLHSQQWLIQQNMHDFNTVANKIAFELLMKH